MKQMTKQEAINLMKLWRASIEMNGADSDHLDAFDMAIEALSEPLRQGYTFGNDEFSLEAAYHDCKLVFDGITDDDSFQEADTGLVLYYANEIIYALQEALKAQGVPDTNVGDYISRQAAIDAVCMEWCNVKHQDCKHPFDVEKDDYYWCDGCETVLRTLPDLPPAQPERKKGKWVRITQGAMPEQYICPFCHRTVEAYGVEELLSIRYPYCHCGADMRGEENG